jgi:hypothetical protein
MLAFELQEDLAAAAKERQRQAGGDQRSPSVKSTAYGKKIACTEFGTSD